MANAIGDYQMRGEQPTLHIVLQAFAEGGDQAVHQNLVFVYLAGPQATFPQFSYWQPDGLGAYKRVETMG